MPNLKRKSDNEHYSYADYLTWSDDERWELIDGVAYNMSPAPGRRHQQLSRNIERQIDSYLKDKPCEMYHAPFDVRLGENQNASDNYYETVVQPDIVVICDKSKLDDRGCIGAPDIVIEILSPSTAAKDLKIKFDLYERYAVKEYWIVYPAEETIMIFKLDENGNYGKPERYSNQDSIKVTLLGELIVDLIEVFED